VSQFTYTALDASGTETTGVLSVDTRRAAIERVAEMGLHPVSVEERDEPAVSEAKRASGLGRVSRASVEAFTRELANLLAAGVSLSRALHILAREASSSAARRQWEAVHDDVVGGASLADALARWPRLFPPVYVAMVHAGETGGFLDVVLEQIADFRARERDLLGRVKAALVYPVVLAVLASAVLAFLLTYFIPRFSAMFAQFGGALPWLTRAIVATSHIAVRYGPGALLFLGVLVVVGRRALAADSGRRAFERAVLRTPAVGRVVARFALVRFCRMLGTLVGAGVPILAALRVAREAVGNQTLADAVNRAIEDLQRGLPLAASLAASPELFPAAVAEMVAVAEESGRLDKELIRLAATYESELDRRLRMLVAVAEPAILFIMAGIVGTVVIGMLLPVFTLQDLIR